MRVELCLAALAAAMLAGPPAALAQETATEGGLQAVDEDEPVSSEQLLDMADDAVEETREEVDLDAAEKVDEEMEGGDDQQE